MTLTVPFTVALAVAPAVALIAVAHIISLRRRCGTHGLRFLTIVCVTSADPGGSTLTGDEYGGGSDRGDSSSSETTVKPLFGGVVGKSLEGITLPRTPESITREVRRRGGGKDGVLIMYTQYHAWP